jgi:tetratricopeptide (TPR) repeat protein
MRNALVALGLVVSIAGAARAQLPTRAERPGADQQRAFTEYETGWSHMRSERFEEALESFTRALELNPRLNLAHYGMGRAYLALRRYDDAVRAFSTCRDNYNSQSGQKFTGQMDAQQAHRDRLTELADLKSQYQKAPQTSGTQDTLRMIENAMRDTQGAASRGVNVAFDLAVPAFVSLSLGSAYFRAEKMPEAEEEFKNTIRADSKSGEAHNNLAVLYFLQGKATLASQHIKAAEKVGFRVNPDLKDQVKEAMAR